MLIQAPPSCEEITIFSHRRLPGNQSSLHAKKHLGASLHAKKHSLTGCYLMAKSEEDSGGHFSLLKTPEATKQACVLRAHQKHLDGRKTHHRSQSCHSRTWFEHNYFTRRW